MLVIKQQLLTNGILPDEPIPCRDNAGLFRQKLIFRNGKLRNYEL